MGNFVFCPIRFRLYSLVISLTNKPMIGRCVRLLYNCSIINRCKGNARLEGWKVSQILRFFLWEYVEFDSGTIPTYTKIDMPLTWKQAMSIFSAYLLAQPYILKLEECSICFELPFLPDSGILLLLYKLSCLFKNLCHYSIVSFFVYFSYGVITVLVHIIANIEIYFQSLSLLYGCLSYSQFLEICRLKPPMTRLLLYASSIVRSTRLTW